MWIRGFKRVIFSRVKFDKYLTNIQCSKFCTMCRLSVICPYCVDYALQMQDLQIKMCTMCRHSASGIACTTFQCKFCTMCRLSVALIVLILHSATSMVGNTFLSAASFPRQIPRLNPVILIMLGWIKLTSKWLFLFLQFMFSHVKMPPPSNWNSQITNESNENS